MSGRKRKLPPSPEQPEKKDEPMEEGESTSQSGSDDSQPSTSAGSRGEEMSSLAKKHEILYRLLQKPLVVHSPAPKKSCLGFRVQYKNSALQSEVASTSKPALATIEEAGETPQVLQKEKCNCGDPDENEGFESVVVLPYSQSSILSAEDFFLYRGVQFDRIGNKIKKLVLVFPENFIEKMNPEPPTSNLRIRSSVLLKEKVPEEKWETCYEGTINPDAYKGRPAEAGESSNASPAEKPNVLATQQESFRIYAMPKPCDANLSSDPTPESKMRTIVTITSRPRSKHSDKAGCSSSSKARVIGPDRYIALYKEMSLLKLRHIDPHLTGKERLIRHAVFNQAESVKAFHCYIVLLPDETFGSFSWHHEPPHHDPVISLEQPPVIPPDVDSSPPVPFVEPEPEPVEQLPEIPQAGPSVPLPRQNYPPAQHLSREEQDLLHRDLRPEDIDTEWNLLVDTLDRIAGVIRSRPEAQEDSHTSSEASASASPDSVLTAEDKEVLPSRVILEVTVSEGEESDPDSDL